MHSAVPLYQDDVFMINIINRCFIIYRQYQTDAPLIANLVSTSDVAPPSLIEFTRVQETPRVHDLPHGPGVQVQFPRLQGLLTLGELRIGVLAGDLY